MRSVSPKRAKRNREAKPFRDAYLAAHWLCEVCIKRPSVEVHEITRGAAREKALDVEDAVLAVCRTCHTALDCNRTWPVKRQLALKALRMNRPPDLLVICELRGEAPTAIVWADVAAELELKR